MNVRMGAVGLVTVPVQVQQRAQVVALLVIQPVQERAIIPVQGHQNRVALLVIILVKVIAIPHAQAYAVHHVREGVIALAEGIVQVVVVGVEALALVRVMEVVAFHAQVVLAHVTVLVRILVEA